MEMLSKHGNSRHAAEQQADLLQSTSTACSRQDNCSVARVAAHSTTQQEQVVALTRCTLHLEAANVRRAWKPGWRARKAATRPPFSSGSMLQVLYTSTPPAATARAPASSSSSCVASSEL